MGNTVTRLHTIWVDGGFDGDPFLQWVMDFCHWIVQVVLRPRERQGFVLLPLALGSGADFGLVNWLSPLEQGL